MKRLIILLIVLSSCAMKPTWTAQYYYIGHQAEIKMNGRCALVVEGKNVSLSFVNGTSTIWWRYTLIKKEGSYDTQYLTLKDSQGVKAHLVINDRTVKLSNNKGTFVFNVDIYDIIKK